MSLRMKLGSMLEKVRFRGLAFALVAGLPLLHVPNNELLSVQLQSLFIVCLGSIVLLYPDYRKVVRRKYSQLGRVTRAALAVFIGFMIVSSVVSNQLGKGEIFFGTYPEYLGLLQWLSCIVLGLYMFGDVEKLAKSRLLLVIVTVVAGLSIVMDRAALMGDFRLHGLLLQATSMGLYGVFVAILALENMSRTGRDIYLAVASFVLSVVCVITSQSRIAIACLIIVVIASLYRSAHSLKVITVSSVLIIFLLLSLAGPVLFSRYQQENVSSGTSYRAEIYQVALNELFSERLIIGNGAGVHPVYLNEQKEVPEDIAKDLAVGLRFASAHDLFIDIGLMFGFVPMIISITALMFALLKYVRIYISEANSIALLFIPLFANALTNVPNLILTPLFIIFLLSGLVYGSTDR